MKHIKFIIPVLLLNISLSSCSKEDDEAIKSTNQVSQLTDEEATDLIYLREEEKLARDVYLHAYELYGSRIFENILQSEQRHMDAVLTLLEIYSIPDPASNDTGTFNDPGLQNLYDHLTDGNAKSLLVALVVGATIEDMDIHDIDMMLTRTSKSDIKDVYLKLNCGSRNHIRAYTDQIENQGSTYEPTYISESRFFDIISSSKEPCH